MDASHKALGCVLTLGKKLKCSNLITFQSNLQTTFQVSNTYFLVRMENINTEVGYYKLSDHPFKMYKTQMHLKVCDNNQLCRT